MVKSDLDNLNFMTVLSLAGQNSFSHFTLKTVYVNFPGIAPYVLPKKKKNPKPSSCGQLVLLVNKFYNGYLKLDTRKKENIRLHV